MGYPAWGRVQETRVGELPERAEILVVGGGITGVSLLHWLRGRGAVLVEREGLAAGASGRNAGFIIQGIGHSYADAVRAMGRRRACDTWAFTVETHDLLEEALAGRSPHHRRRGRVDLPVDEAERLTLEESATLLVEDGFDVRWDGSCLVFPRDGEHNPVETVAALAASAPPGAIREGVEVTALDPGPGGVRVEAGGRECLAEVVILATNGYTGLLRPDAAISPVRAQMAATAVESTVVAGMPTSRDHGFQYWNQLWDGRVAAGGWRNRAFEEEVGYEAVTTERLQGHIDAHLRELGVSAPVTHRWAGIMGFTPDGLPRVARIAPGLYVCGGYNGAGMSLAFHCARRLADHLTASSGGPVLPW